MSGLLVNGSDATFEAEVLKSKGLTLVDFWASWCGPCRMLTPTLEKIAEEMAGSIKIVKINTEENPRIATQYRVQQIPFMMLFKDGAPVGQMVGNRPKPELVKWINQNA